MTRSELDQLLGEEIERRLSLFDAPPDPRELRAAMHTLKGSAAMAGHPELALVIAQLSQRVRSGEPAAIGETGEILRGVLGRIRAGTPPFDTRWPEPPPGLGPSLVDASYRGEYLATVRDRLDELEAALVGPRDAGGLAEAMRAIHSIKGTAAAVGDDVTAWYCHGIETDLKREGVTHETCWNDLPRHKSVVLLLVEDQAAALETLRGKRMTSAAPKSTTAPATVLRRTTQPPVEEDTGEHTVRVQGGSLERVLERIEQLRLSHDELKSAHATASREVRRLRELQVSLGDALRMLGPPRPWGPPAAALSRIDAVSRALAGAAEDLELGREIGRRGAERMRAAAEDIRREIALTRRTKLSAILGKVGAAVERLAEREGRDVLVSVSASDAPVEREVAERLVDPLMQLARNALAHGIEPAEERRSRGKSPRGLLRLSGERAGDWLSIVCEDDGRGVDVEGVRRLAVERGSVSHEAAKAASDDELLALLFVPGLTTKREADLLAGRGVGLDLALNTVRRLGGTIRLERPAAGGLRATLELPSERWTTDVLWLTVGSWELALPVSFSGKVSKIDAKRPPVPLLACLGEAAQGTPKVSLELSLRGIPTVSVGVDHVGEVEQCSLRPLPLLLSQVGPYSGAILRGDGSLMLALDAALLAVRAWALA